MTWLTCFGCIASPLAGHADETLQPIHLRVAGQDVTTKEPGLASDTEIYVPLDVLNAVGATGKLNKNGDAVLVTTAATTKPEELALARPDGRRMLALSDLVRLLHADVVRNEMKGEDGKPIPGSKGDTVYLLARVTDVHYADGSLHVSTSFPVPFHSHMAGANQAAFGYVDCVGCNVPAYFHPTLLPIPETGKERQALRLKANQYSIDTSRVAVELARDTELKDAEGMIVAEGAAISLVTRHADRVAAQKSSDHNGDIARTNNRTNRKPGKAGKRPVTDDKTVARNPGDRNAVQQAAQPTGDGDANVAAAGGAQDGDTTPDAPNAVKPDAPAPAGRGGLPSRSAAFTRGGPAIEVRGVDFLPDDDNQVHIEISTSGRPGNSVHYLDNGKLAIDIPNAMLNLPNAQMCDQTFTHPLMRGLHVELIQETPPVTRITLDTTRVPGFTVNTANDKLTLDIRTPRNSGGVFADKVIVVDAGHGGSSSGATFGGVQEKNITLAISLKLRACLEAAGAKVVMTRDRDVTVPLYDRPTLANAINADLFVSVHNDDTERTNSASGTSTYYHKGDASSRALAACVQQEIVAVSGLPSRGALSDGILYASGLAVLRCSSMPAILVEVAYINNQRDRRKLVDDDFQQHVAQAIADGLRRYVEGSPETIRHTPSSARVNGREDAKPQVVAHLDHETYE